MAELKLYVTIEVDDSFFDEEDYKSNKDYVIEMLGDLADGCMGVVTDLEIK